MSSAGLRVAILLTIMIATATALSVKAKAPAGTRLNCNGNVCEVGSNCVWKILSACPPGLCSGKGQYICESACVSCGVFKTCEVTEENGEFVAKCVNPCDAANCEARGLICGVRETKTSLVEAVCVSDLGGPQPVIGRVKEIVSGIAQQLRNALNP